MSSIEQKVKDIIVEQLGVNPAEVTDSATFDGDLGADSLDIMELVLAFEEAFKDDAYEVATALQGDTEDLTHKAVGWLLREAGKVDRDRLEAYLLKQGPKVPRTTLRYAIEKFPKEDRKRIMAATK